MVFGQERPIRVGENSLGDARVRSSPQFEADDQTKVMGSSPAGTCAAVTESKKSSNGVYLEILVRDNEGKRCRGFLPASIVDGS